MKNSLTVAVLGKKGSGPWTMAKLMKLVLVLVVLIVLALFVPNIAYGVEDIEGYANNALGALRFWDNGGAVVCYTHDVSGVVGNEAFLKDMGIGKDGVKVGVCEGVCNISGGGLVAHRVDGEKFERLDGSDWKKWDALFDGSVEDAKRDWEVYHGGLELLASLDEYEDFLVGYRSTRKLILYGDGEGGVLATWQNNEWTVVKGARGNLQVAGYNNKNVYFDEYGREVLYIGVDDKKALGFFYNETNDFGWFFDDDVYWTILERTQEYGSGYKGEVIGTLIGGLGDFDNAYNSIMAAEHRNYYDEDTNRLKPDYDPWIRTLAEGSSSTAYGPVQLTMGLAKGYSNSKIPWSEDEQDYLNRFIDQGCKFILHGGMSKDNAVDLNVLHSKDPKNEYCVERYEDWGINNKTAYLSKYDYGGSGDLISLKDKKLYRDVAIKMLGDMYLGHDRNHLDMQREWRFGRKDMGVGQDVDYTLVFDAAWVRGRAEGNIAGNVDELNSEKKFNELKIRFSELKFWLLVEINPSAEEVAELGRDIDGKSVDIGGDVFETSVSDKESGLVIKFDSGSEVFGMKYSPHGDWKSGFDFGQGDVLLYASPFVLVEDVGGNWKEMGNPEYYKLREKEFESARKATLIRDFLKEVCL